MCLTMPPNKDWIDLLSALAIPLIATIGIFIAYQQRAINKNRLKHELFDRKYLIFEATKDFLYDVIKDPSVTIEDLNKFHAGTKGAIFIFDSNIVEYLDTLYSKAVQLRAHDKRNEEDESQELYLWFSDQLIEIDQKFKDKIKVGP